MKKIAELDPRTLTLEQKIGQLYCANVSANNKENIDYVIEMIKEHRLGSIWIQPGVGHRKETIERILEAADYPILIMCDAEEGHVDHRIPQQLSITAAGKEEYAFSFGRLTAATHRNMGYNIVCNPVLDLNLGNNPCGSTTRTFGPDKEKVALYGAAMARGMHEGGVLTCAKHYPSIADEISYDTHMREGFCSADKETIIDRAMYAYCKLMEEDLIDGIMTGHGLYPKVDPERPASLSKPLIDIIRELGFDGFLVTDALSMGGVVNKYGWYDPAAMSVAAGNDIPLVWKIGAKEGFEALCERYHQGMFSEADLDRALRHVLEAQHKAALLPAVGEAIEHEIDKENTLRLNHECIAARLEAGLTPSISKDGRHIFIIMTDGKVTIDTEENYTPGPRDWYFPKKIAARIRELFPNSEVVDIPQFPAPYHTEPVFDKQTHYDDVVFITFFQPSAFIGRETLTTRIVDLMDALQSTDRIVAHLHFGNPYVAAYAPYVPRVILGLAANECVMHGLDILAGNAEAKGSLPYDIKFHKKGDIIL